MASEGSQKPGRPEGESFAARLKKKYGEGVDPQVTLGGEGAEAPSGATSELLKRLAEHGVKSPRYKLEGEVARGGMGAILRVWDEDLRRHLAMKVVLGKGDAPATGSTPQIDARVLARFLEEAQVTGQLDHPGIVPVHELGLDADGRVYFTMKLVQGRDLRAIFDLVFQEKEGWNETRALGVLLKACEALAYAHKKGVIHRDLKPANVMVGGFGEVYVMDWGLARVQGRADTHDLRLVQGTLGADAPESVKTERSEEREGAPDSPFVTMDGDVMGTPAYMPPEQARGEIDRLSSCSDVYSIGAMLYHLLARHPPYTPPNSRMTLVEVLSHVVKGPPQLLHGIRKDVPEELEAICEKAMAREPERRYADTLALAEDLRAYIEHRVVGAYETGAVAELKKWVTRNKPLAASIAAALVLSIGGLSWVSIVQSRAREAIATKNKDLSAATKLAQDNEALAKEQEQRATQKTNDVLSLSAIQDVKELEDRADALWPADPENVPSYEKWLADARALMEGQPADPAGGIKKRPSLAEHEAKLADIRARAKPLTPEQVDLDRRASPSFAEWEKASAQLLWMRRMLGEEPWPKEAEIEASLSKETLPTNANALNTLAWPLVDVDPAKVVYGNEVRGLILARRAVADAKESERAAIRDTLGWALYRRGRLDEALVEERRAVDEAQDKQKEELGGSLDQMQKQVALWKGADAHSKQSEAVSRLASRAAELQGIVEERHTYDFEDGEDRWWYAQLSKLVSDLKSFTDEKSGGLYSSGTSEKHGWGIVKRAEFARTIRERSLDGARAKKLWDEAIAAIASSARYGGLKIEPQLGFLPIGPDPESSLWEFAHLATGEQVERGSDGKLVLKEAMGLVFVLIPGGTFRMGAHRTDPAAPNYDPQARSDESPVHEVMLSPYLLSKYEMTQSQWERFVGHNPSSYGPARFSKSWNRSGKGWSGLHPVEQVTGAQCMEVMVRLGLSLPSEAQWEKGARGGQDTPWWTGSDLGSLKDAANLSDAYGKSHGNESLSVWEKDFDDGNTVHAEVGSYRANPFGLHDVVGNVWEWCLDGYGEGFYGSSARVDPVAPWTSPFSRVRRGGGFSNAASDARSAGRDNHTPEYQSNDLGLRPAMAPQLSASQLHPAGK